MEKDDIVKLITEKVAEAKEQAFHKILSLHIRALACHCECLGMNAENMWAAIGNHPPVYLSAHYRELMQKWKLIDKEGEPLI